MLNAFESVSIIAASIVGALLFLLLFRRFWLPKGKRQHNDVIGWQISFLATTYAVIMAFMLSDVWRAFQAAETNAEIEANALVNMFRVAQGLPPAQQSAVQQLTRRYAELMITEEWPAMTRGAFGPDSHRTVVDIWNVVIKTQARDPMEQASLQRELADLSNMTEHRRIRQLQSRSKMPGIFWFVLIVGGTMTVLYTCLFDVEEPKMHILQVVVVTFVVSLVLVTIADVDGPYGGAVRIQPTAFELALKTMGDADAQNR